MNGNGAIPSEGTAGAFKRLSPDGRRAQPANPKVAVPPETSGLTILVADDDASIRNLVAQGPSSPAFFR